MLLVLLLGSVAGGCAARRDAMPTGTVDYAAVPVSVEPALIGGRVEGSVVRTPHYEIYTTFPDDESPATLAHVMEGALAQYRLLVPDVTIAPDERPMQCYVFHRRHEWAAFTERVAGPDAAVYLQISRGGYAMGDRFVAHRATPGATYIVAAHEGWHQFVGRHFQERLPPLLEEGLACVFESVRIGRDGEPHWNLSRNPTRAASLRYAIESETLWPLERLIEMHAGQVVGAERQQIETFYAQAWALALFLWEAEDGRYRAGLQQLLTDTAAGTARQAAGLPPQRHPHLWSPRTAKPLLEHYFGQHIEALAASYDQYIRDLAGR